KKPTHVVVPTIAAAKRLVHWNNRAQKIANAFWPGSVTMVLPLKAPGKNFDLLSAGTGTLGLRMPKHKIALDLAKKLGRPITATGANVDKGGDAYSLDDLLKQFQKRRLKPDIIISVGTLPKRKPSTIVKLTEPTLELLRLGPVSLKQIQHVL